MESYGKRQGTLKNDSLLFNVGSQLLNYHVFRSSDNIYIYDLCESCVQISAIKSI